MNFLGISIVVCSVPSGNKQIFPLPKQWFSNLSTVRTQVTWGTGWGASCSTHPASGGAGGGRGSGLHFQQAPQVILSRLSLDHTFGNRARITYFNLIKDLCSFLIFLICFKIFLSSSNSQDYFLLRLIFPIFISFFGFAHIIHLSLKLQIMCLPLWEVQGLWTLLLPSCVNLDKDTYSPLPLLPKFPYLWNEILLHSIQRIIVRLMPGMY